MSYIKNSKRIPIDNEEQFVGLGDPVDVMMITEEANYLLVTNFARNKEIPIFLTKQIHLKL